MPTLVVWCWLWWCDAGLFEAFSAGAPCNREGLVSIHSPSLTVTLGIPECVSSTGAPGRKVPRCLYCPLFCTYLHFLYYLHFCPTPQRAHHSVRVVYSSLQNSFLLHLWPFSLWTSGKICCLKNYSERESQFARLQWLWLPHLPLVSFS